MIVVDASVLIAHLDRKDSHHERAVQLLSKLVDWPLAASPITVAEVLVQPARVSRLPEARAALRSLDVTDERLLAAARELGLARPDSHY